MAVSIVLGVAFVVLGVWLLWLSTLGARWANTHNRSFQRKAPASKRQATYNRVAGLAVGTILVPVGVVLVAVRPL